MKASRATPASKPSAHAASTNRLRIIGGQWRGTRLQFPEHAAIRPTPDRVRETLFNWLQQHIAGTHCLDLFAGSGALSLEALSRGAKSAVLIEREPMISRYLSDTLARLQCTTAEVHTGDALNFLQQATQSFDLVFLDPPFADAEFGGLLARLLQQLETCGHLNPRALIYLECPSSLGAPTAWAHWPGNWHLHRSAQAGQVGYHLARRNPPDAST
ncbi:MAG: 16S rRNA (guanine(966)-N(2))-methyltransferase RsmD [Steroidobacteraceae bacterium]